MEDSVSSDTSVCLEKVLSVFIPSGLKISALGDWTASDTESLLGGEPVEAPSEADMVVFTEGSDPQAALHALDVANSNGIPIGCLIHPRDLAGDRATWTLEAFEREIESRGLVRRIQLLRHQPPAVVYFCAPPATSNINWWNVVETARVIDRLGKRGVKQRRKYDDRGPSGNWGLVSASWNERADLAATMIPQGTRLMDVGCGAMYLEVATKPAFYLPVDIEARDERTRVLDLNRTPLPAEWLDEVDHVAFMGVFEYLDDPLGVVARCARHGKTMICSYNHAEARKPQLTAKRFANNLTLDEVEAMFAQAGYAIARREPFHTNQFVWLLVPAAGVAGGEG